MQNDQDEGSTPSASIEHTQAQLLAQINRNARARDAIVRLRDRLRTVRSEREQLRAVVLELQQQLDRERLYGAGVQAGLQLALLALQDRRPE